jgi:2-haloacid dehalogenase
VTSKGNAACVFDAYGTLFNVHSAVARHANSLGKGATEISNLWRAKQLEYSWVHSLMRRHVDFWELTQRALDYALALYRVGDDRLKRALMESYLALDAYDEIPSVLRRLREADIKNRHPIERFALHAAARAWICGYQRPDRQMPLD